MLSIPTFMMKNLKTKLKKSLSIIDKQFIKNPFFKKRDFFLLTQTNLKYAYFFGVTTPSITWITPFDWFTSAIVTFAFPPFSSDM